MVRRAAPGRYGLHPGLAERRARRGDQRRRLELFGLPSTLLTRVAFGGMTAAMERRHAGLAGPSRSIGLVVRRLRMISDAVVPRSRAAAGLPGLSMVILAMMPSTGRPESSRLERCRRRAPGPAMARRRCTGGRQHRHDRRRQASSDLASMWALAPSAAGRGDRPAGRRRWRSAGAAASSRGPCRLPRRLTSLPADRQPAALGALTPAAGNAIAFWRPSPLAERWSINARRESSRRHGLADRRTWPALWSAPTRRRDIGVTPVVMTRPALRRPRLLKASTPDRRTLQRFRLTVSSAAPVSVRPCDRNAPLGPSNVQSLVAMVQLSPDRLLYTVDCVDPKRQRMQVDINAMADVPRTEFRR